MLDHDRDYTPFSTRKIAQLPGLVQDEDESHGLQQKEWKIVD